MDIVKIKVSEPKGKILKTVEVLSPTWVLGNVNSAAEVYVQVIGKIREGVRKAEWKQLIETIDVTEKYFEEILPSSISSMQKKQVYGKETSERIYEISKIYGLGFAVFDSQEDFKSWLNSPLKTLGNMKPFDLLDNSFGFQLVENEIMRIQHNVYS